MAQITRKWIEDRAIDGSKLDTSASFVMAGLSATSVGIGTTSPQDELHIRSTAVRAGIRLQLADGLSGRTYRMLTNSAGQYVIVDGALDSTRVVLDSVGKLGIGTTPETEIHLYRLLGDSRVRLDTGAGVTARYQLVADATGGGFAIYDVGTSQYRMMIDSTGGVGIGTTRPKDDLHVYAASGDAGLLLETQTGTAKYEMVSKTDGGFYVRDAKTALDRLQIDSNGNLRVYKDTTMVGGLAVQGTTTIVNQQMVISDRLEVNGDGVPDSTVMAVRQSNAGATSRLMVLENAGSGAALTITGNSVRVGIGTTNPSVSLGIVGSNVSCKISGSGTVANSLQINNTGADAYFGVEGATPGAFFTGSLAYGTVIYSTTAIQHIVGGISRMAILGNGTVGIGLTSPVAMFDVAADGASYYQKSAIFYNYSASSLQGGIQIRTGRGSYASPAATQNGDRQNLINLYQRANASSGITAAIDYVTDGVASTYTDGHYEFRIVRTNDGLLHVPLSLYASNITTGQALRFNPDREDFDFVFFGTAAATAPVLYGDAANGFVGIGTTQPAVKVHVIGDVGSATNNVMSLDGNQWFNLGNRSGYPSINAFTKANGTTWVNTHATVLPTQISMEGGYIAFNVAGSNSGIGNVSSLAERVRITAGNVGIGTNNPVTKLDVWGSSPGLTYDGQEYITGIETSGAANTGGGIGFIGHDGVSSRNWGAIQLLKENSTAGDINSYFRITTRDVGGLLERVRVTSSGRMGIGIPNPGSTLHVNGSLQLASGASVNNIDTDTDWTTATDAMIPTKAAVKTYVTGLVGGSSYWSRASSTVYLGTSTDSLSIGTSTAIPGAKANIRPTSDADSLIWQRQIDGLEMGRLGVNGGLGAGRYGYMALNDATGVIGLMFNAAGDSYFKNGNIGIGTNTPTTKTHIYTTDTGTSLSSMVRLANNANGSGGQIYSPGLEFGTAGSNTNARLYATRESGTGGTLILQSANSSGTLVDRITIPPTGNVGIGTIPSATLDVNGAHTSGYGMATFRSSNAAYLCAIATSENAGLRMQTTPGTDLWSISSGISGGGSAVDALKFSTNTYLRAVITQDGKVGIGSNAPTDNLDVLVDTGNAGITVKTSDSLSSAVLTLKRGTAPGSNSTGSISVNSDGMSYVISGALYHNFDKKVSIGVGAAPAAGMLEVAGHIIDRNSVALNTSIGTATYPWWKVYANNLSVGIGTTITPLGVIHGADTNQALQYLDTYKSSGAPSSEIIQRRSRNASLGGLTATQVNDQLGALVFQGVDSANAGFRNGVKIVSYMDGGSGATWVGGRVHIQTTKSTSSTVNSNALVVDSDGRVGVGKLPISALTVDGSTDADTYIALDNRGLVAPPAASAHFQLSALSDGNVYYQAPNSGSPKHNFDGTASATTVTATSTVNTKSLYVKTRESASASIIVGTDDYLICAGGTTTVILPAIGSNLGRVIYVKKFGNFGFAVTINTSGTDVIVPPNSGAPTTSWVWTLASTTTQPGVCLIASSSGWMALNN